MNELLSNVHIVLQNAGYATWETQTADIPTVVFEDDSVMGFIMLFDTAAALAANWRDAESAALGQYATSLRSAGEKAWNVYCAFVTSEKASPEDAAVIRRIEENLDRTRKIAAAGSVSRADVVSAFLPLLPIVSKPVLAPEDPSERLRRRVASIAPGAEDSVLDDGAPMAEVLRRIGEAL